MMRRRNWFGWGPGPEPSKKDRAAQRQSFQSAVRRKARSLGSERRRKAREKASADLQLFRQLQGDGRPRRRGGKHKPKTERFRGHVMTDAELDRFIAENPKGAGMATKKRKKKKNPRKRKGVMPAALKRYWAKMRGKKNPAKKRRKKRNSVAWGSMRPRKKKKKNPRRRPVARRRRPVSTMVRNFRRNPAKRRRRRTYNPRPQNMTINAPSGLGPKGLKQFRSAIARASGMRTRVVKR